MLFRLPLLEHELIVLCKHLLFNFELVFLFVTSVRTEKDYIWAKRSYGHAREYLMHLIDVIQERIFYIATI